MQFADKLTRRFADQMTRSQQRRQVLSSGELSVKVLVIELVCQRNVPCSYRKTCSQVQLHVRLNYIKTRVTNLILPFRQVKIWGLTP